MRVENEVKAFLSPYEHEDNVHYKHEKGLQVASLSAVQNQHLCRHDQIKVEQNFSFFLISFTRKLSLWFLTCKLS